MEDKMRKILQKILTIVTITLVGLVNVSADEAVQAMAVSGNPAIQHAALDSIAVHLNQGKNLSGDLNALGIMAEPRANGQENDPMVRYKAIQILGAAGDKALPVLTRLLVNEEDSLAAAAETVSLGNLASVDKQKDGLNTIIFVFEHFNYTQPASNTLAEAFINALSQYQKDCGKYASEAVGALNDLSLNNNYKTGIRQQAHVLAQTMMQKDND
jgi:hypothetical protein